jgi:glycosylphosphatidylinositol transamidase (GPIT) subunit GPI8
LLEFVEDVAARPDRKYSLQDLTKVFTFDLLGSNAGWRTDLYRRRLTDVPVTDFFGAVVHVESASRDVSPLPLADSVAAHSLGNASTVTRSRNAAAAAAAAMSPVPSYSDEREVISAQLMLALLAVVVAVSAATAID